MAISHAYVAVTSRATNGACVLKTGKGIAEVNRGPGAGLYSVNFLENLDNAYYAVDVTVNMGDATHRFYVYNRVSERQVDVRIFSDDAVPVGLDADFTVEVWSDADGSIGA